MKDVTKLPHPEDLSSQDRMLLQDLAVGDGDFTVEQLGDEWYDDHIVCVALRVRSAGREIDTAIWWCGPPLVGALCYCDESPRAKADVIAEINKRLP